MRKKNKGECKGKQGQKGNRRKKGGNWKRTKLIVCDHPLALEKLGRIRDKTVSSREKIMLADDLSVLLAYEVFRDLKTEEIIIDTPIERGGVRRVSEMVNLVPVLRAGQALVPGMRRMLSNLACVGYVGYSRDENTLKPHGYCMKLPRSLDGRCVVLETMLATGGTAVAVCKALKKRGAKRIQFVVFIAAPEGIRKLHKKCPYVDIIVVDVDEGLTKEGFIRGIGAGDVGDELFNTRA